MDGRLNEVNSMEQKTKTGYMGYAYDASGRMTAVAVARAPNSSILAYNLDILSQLLHGFFAAKPRGRLNPKSSFQTPGFQSGLYDPDTGLVQFRARWYDPSTGRWLSKDPILLEGGLNLYAFCGNDPVNFRDPWGLCEGVREGLGKLWNLPNSALGLGLGLLQILGGADPSWGNNGLQFENCWLMFPDSGLTLGNVMFYEGSASDTYGLSYTIGDHERQHTHQGEVLGPFYLPAYVAGMMWAGLQGKDPFGPANFMEAGPYKDPKPQVWP